VLHDLDDRSRAVEKDARSPGGQGYTGLEALLQYSFNQVLAIDYFGPFGHWLALDLNLSAMCSPYATPGTIAMQLKQYGSAYRQCYTWLGPNQPGVNETDPSNPTACVPDPGGAPPGERGPVTSACRMSAAVRATTRKAAAKAAPRTTVVTQATGARSLNVIPTITGSSSRGAPTPGLDLHQTISQLLSVLGGSSSTPSPSNSGGQAARGSSGAAPADQAQQLLNYLLSP
jgi:hypothetical protein